MNIAQSMPESLKKLVRPGIRYFRKLQQSYRGVRYWGRERYCPVCNRNFSKFGKTGVIPREDALCMCCRTVERHRLVWLYFQRRTNLFNGENITMLHVAPELAIEKKLRRQLRAQYFTADLFNPSAMIKMDITDIQYPDESFDAIYCSHVLEHVVDDKKAMREFFRVLKPEGWAILLVPINADKTFEDPSIIDPAERLAKFGDAMHVRCYGPDYVDRLREAKFNVQVTKPADFLTQTEIVRMGITAAAGEIYFCTKQHVATI